ncbi:MAG: enoyl-CoA hydratase/isomerase family protein [Acidimicrobiales bacterium]
MIDVYRRGAVAVVELAKGKVNAIDVDLLNELGVKLEELSATAEVSAAVLTGRGSAFSAGVDLRKVLDGGAEYAESLIVSLRETFERLFSFSKPTVAAVNGAAIAGGCVVACACDRTIVAEGAKIGASELLVGVSFPASAVEILRSACGDRVDDVILGGEIVEGERALSLGLADEVVPPESVLERSVQVAESLGGLAPEAFELAKQQLRRPSLDRMRSGASEWDSAVIRQWSSPETRARIAHQLENLARR